MKEIELLKDKLRLDRLDATLQPGFHWAVTVRGGAWEVIQIPDPPMQHTPTKRTVRDALDNAIEHEPVK